MHRPADANFKTTTSISKSAGYTGLANDLLSGIRAPPFSKLSSHDSKIQNCRLLQLLGQNLLTSKE